MNDWTGRFELYDKANPQVYELFKTFANGMAVNHKRGSAKLIMERVRWETDVMTTREQGMPKLKINNNYTALYARKLATEDPFFKSFFHTRDRVKDKL